MKIPLQFILALATVAAVPGVLRAGSAPDVGPPASREDAIAFAQSVLDAQAVPAIPPADAALKNPFNPIAPAGAKPVDADVTIPPDDYVLLQSMAAQLSPDGTLRFGDDDYLVLNHKRYKTGDSIPAIFGGKQYQLQLVRIRGTSFTLRLNGTEITRPIQQSSSKP